MLHIHASWVSSERVLIHHLESIAGFAGLCRHRQPIWPLISLAGLRSISRRCLHANDPALPGVTGRGLERELEKLLGSPVDFRVLSFCLVMQ